MAAEVRRVGRRWFVQTPDRAFPVEPHYLAPFVHWLPPCERQVREVRLLSAAELRALFPDGSLVRERFAGLGKSLIAIGPGGPQGLARQ